MRVGRLVREEVIQNCRKDTVKTFMNDNLMPILLRSNSDESGEACSLTALLFLPLFGPHL
jgi:hypothetical protein